MFKRIFSVDCRHGEFECLARDLPHAKVLTREVGIRWYEIKLKREVIEQDEEFTRPFGVILN